MESSPESKPGKTLMWFLGTQSPKEATDNCAAPPVSLQRRRQDVIFWTKYQKPLIILYIGGIMVITGLIIFILAAGGYVSEKFLLRSIGFCFGFSAIALGIIMMILIEESEFFRPRRVAHQSPTHASTTT